MESIENKKGSLISPDGKIQNLTTAEITAITHSRPRYSVGFSEFEHQGKKGMYLALSEKDLTNVLQYEKYSHLGTYDLFITYAHELFHMSEQNKWKSPEKVINASRSDRFEDLDARVQRNLIYQQVLKAIVENDTVRKQENIKAIVSSYRYYQKNFPEDYKNSLFMDRIEGSAYYFEMITSLYSAYPNQIKTEHNLYEGLKLIAQNTNPFEGIGLGIEGYWLSGWTGVLLDQYEGDQKNDWKLQLMNNPNSTPLEILSNKFNGIDLPTPQRVTEKDKLKIQSWIKQREETSNLPALFQFMYQIIF